MDNRIEKNYVVSKNEESRGMITGTVIVKSGVRFINHGMICDDVVVEENGVFQNHGMVTGNVMGEGYAEVWGMVGGYVSSMLSTYVHRNAVINGKRYEEDEKHM